MSYEQEMHIDEDALDVELLEQPSLMARYSYKLAEAKRDRDIAKEKLELIKAEINLDIRDNPNKYNLEKATDNAVNAAILMEADYKDAQVDVHQAQFEVDVLQGVINAIDHRKSALEQLVKLLGQDYFAPPVVPHDLSQLRKERNKEIENRIAVTFRRRKT